jgi:hypothetical protein
MMSLIPIHLPLDEIGEEKLLPAEQFARKIAGCAQHT